MKFYLSTAFIALLLLLFSGCSEKKNSFAELKPKEKFSPVLDIIVESKQFADIYHYLQPEDYHKDTLVLFDIDNTIAHPPTDLGSDQWFHAMCKRLEEQGMSFEDAIHHFIPTYFYIMRHIPLIPVESDTVSIINDLHNKGVTIIGLTARSIDIHHRTVEQLEALGIRFSKAVPHEFYIKECRGKMGLFSEGIIFSGNCDKGELLNLWLKKVGYHPKKVIFVDDKLKNIQSVERALHKRNYPFIGIRYGYLDDRVRNLDLDAAEKEYQEFIVKFPPPQPILSSMYS